MSNSNGNQPKGEEQKLLTAQTASQTIIPAKSTVVIGGSSYTQAQLVQKLASMQLPFQTARDARKQLEAAVLAKDQSLEAVHEFYVEFHAALVALFGRRNPVLAKFGFTPAKARAVSGTRSVQRAAKAKRTRALLHTLGSKQKALIMAQAQQGTPAVTVSPNGEISISPAPDASSSAPASAESNGTPSVTGGTGGSPSSK